MRYLITGGSGTLGTALVNRLLEEGAERIVVYSRGEHRQQKLAESLGLNIRGDGSPVRFFIGDVRDQARLRMAMHGITHVIHAAALKIVPAGEYNPTEFIRTNVIGAQNVIETAIEMGVQRVVGISTDKACGPVNLYGATKLCAEKAFVAANAYGGGRTKFSVARYGNVTGSQGSVVPIWYRLAKEGLSLPVTSVDMTRFWMTLEEAVDFVLESLWTMDGGEVFVPMLPSYSVMALAHAVWSQAGAEPPMAFDVVGVRPGEKLHESMVSADESQWGYAQPELARLAILPGPRDGWVKATAGEGYSSDNSKVSLEVEDLMAELEELGYR